MSNIMLWTLTLLLAITFDVGQSAKFLLPSVSLFSTPSHYMGLTTITKALIEQGHEVSLLILDRKGTKGFVPGSYTTNITFPNPLSDERLANFMAFKEAGMSSVKNQSIVETLRDPRVWEFKELFYFGCFELFKNEDILLQMKQEHFDMMITSPATELCDVAIAAYLDIPFTVLLSTRRFFIYHEDMFGIPIPTSYVPFSVFTSSLSDRMSFLERVQNAVFYYGVQKVVDYFLIYRPIGQLQSTYGIRPDLTPWQMVSRPELVLCQSTWAFEYPRPIGPNWIPIPGYTIKDPKPLPPDLEAFVQGTGEHGFIIFTLGSQTTSLGTGAINDVFAKVFSELPQRVIWRFLGPTPRNLGKNTLISDWLPQNDLLGHPKARLLIYHAGGGGVHEAINYGVPMLLLPLAGDQMTNAHLVEDRGMGRQLEPNALDEASLRTAIHEVLHNHSYKANVLRASHIMKDRLSSPLATAIFWIEHVVKFGGGHLRPRAVEMGFIELNSIDVVAFLVVLMLIILYIDYLLIRGCFRCAFGSRRKQKSD